MRWSPDKVIVIYLDVVIDLYALVTFGCFFRNVLILLYVIVPSKEAEFQNSIKVFEMMENCK